MEVSDYLTPQTLYPWKVAIRTYWRGGSVAPDSVWKP
jgi:hypothetical protein